MKTLIIIFSFLLVTSVSHAQKIPIDAKIILTRTSAGTPPSYTLTVYADGRIDYKPGPGAKKIKAGKKLSEKEISGILQKFDEMKFPKLADDVKVYKKCCAMPKPNVPVDMMNLCFPTLVTDVPTTEISVTQRGRTSVIVHDGTCHGDKIFKPIDRMAKEIDKAAGL